MQQYLLKGKDIDAKPIQLTEVQNPVNAPREEAVAEDNIDKSPAAPEESADVTPAAASTEENDDAATAAASSVDESSDGTAAAAGGAEQSSDDDAATAGAEESSETTQEDSGDQEVAEETPEIKVFLSSNFISICFLTLVFPFNITKNGCITDILLEYLL